MNSFIRYLGLCFFLVALVACSGSSGDGSSGGDNDSSESEIARINAGNAEQLGTAAAEGVKQAVEYQTAPDLGFRPSARPTIDSISSDLAKSFAGRTASAPAAITCTTGSIVEDNNPDGSTTVTFNLCDIGFGLILDGVVNTSSSVSGNITTVELEYVDFTISFAGDDTTLNFEASCATDNTTMETSCAFPGVVGFDGRIYDFYDASVSGDQFSGYNITATIVDPDHGRFTIVTTDPILFGCANGQPMAGALQFTDGIGVLVTVTFNDCASFTVSYSGTSEIYLW
jgi:hypothetical protein